MTAAPATVPDISPDFVASLAERAQEAEGLRRLPRATVDDFVAPGLADLLVPLRYGGIQAPWPAVLDPVRRMAHGCSSSAWTLGFYILHNWMVALFGEEAQEEAFAMRPFLAPRPWSPAGGVRRRRRLPRPPAAADQTRRRRAVRPRDIRLRHQPGACGRADTGNGRCANRNGVRKGYRSG
jgi:hypothetical protein